MYLVQLNDLSLKTAIKILFCVYTVGIFTNIDGTRQKICRTDAVISLLKEGLNFQNNLHRLTCCIYPSNKNINSFKNYINGQENNNFGKIEICNHRTINFHGLTNFIIKFLKNQICCQITKICQPFFIQNNFFSH